MTTKNARGKFSLRQIEAKNHEIKTLVSAAEYAFAAAGEFQCAGGYDGLAIPAKTRRKMAMNDIRVHGLRALEDARRIARTCLELEITWGANLDELIRETK